MNGNNIKINTIDKFQIHNNPTHEKETLLNVSSIPVESEFVSTNKLGKIKLSKKLAAGGEGTVYSIDKDSNLVCKIYKKERLTNLRKKKLELMVAKVVDCKGICWPKEIVYNQKNEFVGYIMDKAEGNDLGKTLFIKPIFIKAFPSWTRTNLANLCTNILRKIKYLHDRNIILGDINPFNILIKNDTDIYFVDCDSYQIEQYPCPVGTIPYTPPELHVLKKKYSEYLRTFEHEYFAVATLLFMILLPGKSPYDQIGGDSIIEAIKEMDFPYPLGDKSKKTAPKGLWRFMWSNLTFNLKFAFYNSFNDEKELDNEKSKKEIEDMVAIFTLKKRLNINIWLDILDGYLFALKKDFLSNEIYPENLKLFDPIEVVCKECGKHFKTEKEAYNQGKVKTCWSCVEMSNMLNNNNSKTVNYSKPVTNSYTQNIGKSSPQVQLCSKCGGKGKNTCKACNGSGKQYSTVYVNCKTCKGVGTISTFFGFLNSKCPDCNGAKRKSTTQESKCSMCYGTGSITCSNCNGKGKF